MRIALVHSFYRSGMPSGENLVVAEQEQLLRASGHEVRLVRADSDQTSGRFSQLPRMALDVARGTGGDPSRELAAFRPDVVHVHNLFPNFATRWLADWPGPLVATLHNFRPMCIAADLLRDGQICTLCPDGDRWAGLRHRCYRGSLAASLPIAWRNRGGVPSDPVIQRADALVTISQRAQEVYRRAGVAANRMRLIPNSVAAGPAGGGGPAPQPTASGSPNRWIAVGRLSAEKGLLDLVRIWPDDQRLDIVGSGPQQQLIARNAPASVELLGELPRQQVLRMLASGRYSGALFAGAAIEGGYTLTAVEAMAAGLPLVARDSAAPAPLVREYDCGVVYDGSPGSLVAALARVASQRAEMGARARAAWSAGFSPQTWLDRMQRCYESVV